MIEGKEGGTIHQVPIEDLGWLVVEHPEVTMSAPLLGCLASESVAVIFCDKQYMPSGMLLPLAAYYKQRPRHDAQLAMAVPLKKQLWRKTVQAKISQQAALLALCRQGEVAKALEAMAREVRSGDATNVEAQAARAYWPSLLGASFYRAPAGAPPNQALNYGYAILRSVTARALAGHGFIPTLGIHHRNQYNAFCLADDMMEPYRPFVDRAVHEIYLAATPSLSDALDKEQRILLAELLHTPCLYAGESTLLSVAVKRTAASLAKCIEKGQTDLLTFASFV